MAGDRPVTNSVVLPNGSKVTLASPHARIIARIIDVSFVVGYFYAIKFVFRLDLLSGWTDNPSGNEGLSINVADAGILFFGLFLAELITGQGEQSGKSVLVPTHGKRFVGLRVVDAHNGGAVSFRSGIIRISTLIAAFIVSLFVLNNAGLDASVRWEFSWTLAVIPILPIFWSSFRQGWHDYAAGTLVISERGQISEWLEDILLWLKSSRLGKLMKASGPSDDSNVQDQLSVADTQSSCSSNQPNNRRVPGKRIKFSRNPVIFVLFVVVYFVFPILGIVHLIDIFFDHGGRNCFAALDTIYEQAKSVPLAGYESPQLFVDEFIDPTLKNRSELLEIGYLEDVSTDHNCSLSSLERYVDDWKHDDQNRLIERSTSPEIQELDEIWSNFPSGG